MASYKYLKHYQKDDNLINSYHSFTQNIFSFDLSIWRDKEFWQDSYIPHSLVLDNEIIANISASIMHLQVNGAEIKAVQLGSVGVLPKFRGLDLARLLMEKVLNEYSKYPLIFLFASDDVSEFYKKFGFIRVDEGIPYVNVKEDISLTKPAKITLESKNIDKLLSTHSQYSSILDARGNPNIYWFHLLYNFKNNIYYIQEKDVLFIARYKNNIVDVYDVMSNNKIAFEDIKGDILKERVAQVNFHFTPDWLDVDYHILPRKDKAIYIYGNLQADLSNAKFPKTGTT